MAAVLKPMPWFTAVTPWALIDPADREHRHEDLHLGEHPTRVPGEQRLELVGPVGGHHDVDPVAGDVDPRQRAGLDQLVHLSDHHPAAERGGLGDHRGVLGVRSGVEVAVPVAFLCGNQRDVREQVEEHPRVELEVGVDRPYPQRALADQLGHPQRLRPGVGEVDPRRDSLFEEVEVLGPGQARHHHVQVVHPVRIHLHERSGEEVGLLLIVPLERDAVARRDHCLECAHGAVGGEHLAVEVRRDAFQPLAFARPADERLHPALPSACPAERSGRPSSRVIPTRHGASPEERDVSARLPRR